MAESVIFENEFIRQGILLDKEFNPALPLGRETSMDVPAFIREVLEETNLNQTKFGRKVGVSQGTVSKWINEGHEPNKRQWDAVLKFASRYPRLRAMIKEGIMQTVVPVMGRIGGGAEIEPDYEQVPPEGLEQVDVPFPIPPDIIGFKVEGESMRPAYRNGDVILVYREQHLDTDTFIGQEVAVRTAEGKRYLKELHRGERRGLYDLHSHNAAPITGARVVWIGAICAVVKAGQLRRQISQTKKIAANL